LFTFLALWLTFHTAVHFSTACRHVLEVKLAHYSNRGKETLYPFIDSSRPIDNVLLQTNPGCTGRYDLDFPNIPKLYLVDIYIAA